MDHSTVDILLSIGASAATLGSAFIIVWASRRDHKHLENLERFKDLQSDHEALKDAYHEIRERLVGMERDIKNIERRRSQR